MILTQQFPSPDAAVSFFNANAALRLVSVLPSDHAPAVTALYETPPDPDAAVEEERRLALEDRVLALLNADNDRKEAMNFPRAILDETAVPLSIVSNKLSRQAIFKDMEPAERAEWIRVNAAAIDCTYLSSAEAHEAYGCTAELLRVEE